tara:strand:+ start:969 stop:1391 length:423 start_codon:yes stop_codon:yes gene_type:complete
MHRAALGSIAVLLAGCATEIPQIKPGSLKPVAKSEHAPVKPITANAAVAPVIVTGPDDAENKRIALAMFHGLNLAGHDIKSTGNAWKVHGRVHEGFITWTVFSPDGSTVGAVAQRGVSDPAVAAVVPGVRSYLPRPSTNL